MCVFEYLTIKYLAKYWRYACNMKVLITQGAISEAPRQIWRFKEDFLEGMMPWECILKSLRIILVIVFIKRMVQFLTTEISIYQSLPKFNLSF